MSYSDLNKQQQRIVDDLYEYLEKLQDELERKFDKVGNLLDSTLYNNSAGKVYDDIDELLEILLVELTR